MDEVGILEARNTLSALIERVERGEEVTITRHGRPVAKLVSTETDDERKARVRAAIDWIRANRAGNSLDGASIKDMIEEGRRF
ncbi:type II toxin-antitoxin system prevent-host-death family antitoxin [Hoeflea sp.]|uniref:type II toxin-antitoxin system Phd/YefM family antitoxin n=1 Tax=Hoeflea sp. TaxID=1940281 RepID=UPI0019A9A701|nr:type II toxin-antitoxin system prevent-host-death family antitoxin [Hoeflea sp.]MBC7282553.1 type II toxin-antitoxin system prevent-host-death family antitoxin [Hoeflea sp.]